MQIKCDICGHISCSYTEAEMHLKDHEEIEAFREGGNE